jgi:hypothetical protein
MPAAGKAIAPCLLEIMQLDYKLPLSYLYLRLYSQGRSKFGLDHTPARDAMPNAIAMHPRLYYGDKRGTLRDRITVYFSSLELWL